MHEELDNEIYTTWCAGTTLCSLTANACLLSKLGSKTCIHKCVQLTKTGSADHDPKNNCPASARHYTS